MEKSKDRVIVVGADYHGDWAKDIFLAFQKKGISCELIFTNTIFKGTDNNTDATKRARLEKIKEVFRNRARPIFNFVKERRRLASERTLVGRIQASHRPGEKLFVIFIWTPPSVSILKNLKKREGIILVMWLGEAPVREARWPLSFPYFDYFLYVGKQWLVLLDEEVQKRATFLPLASSPEKFFPLKEKRQEEGKFASDIIFVGYYLKERAEVLSAIKDYDFKIFGYWWETGMKEFPWIKENYYGPLSNEDANRAFNEGKIEIGRALTYTSYSNCITQRVFDISLAGNFQLSGYSPEIEEAFGDSIPMFRDKEELKKLVDHYLAQPEERSRLAAKAHEIALRDHTYAKRIETLIDLLSIR